jgi:hypothetical protein
MLVRVLKLIVYKSCAPAVHKAFPHGLFPYTHQPSDGAFAGAFRFSWRDESKEERFHDAG